MLLSEQLLLLTSKVNEANVKQSDAHSMNGQLSVKRKEGGELDRERTKGWREKDEDECLC